MTDVVMSAAVALGLISLLSWGTADFIARSAIKKIGPFSALLFAQIISIVPIAIWAAIIGLPQITTVAFGVVVISGVLMVMSYLMFFKAIDRGMLSLVSPVSSSWGAITALLSLTILAEALSFNQTVGIVIIFIGLFLTSIDLREFLASIKGKMFKGVPEALTAMLGWGVAFFILKFAADALGAIWAVLLMRTVGILVLLALAGSGHSKVTPPLRPVIPLLLAMGLLDAAAFIAYSFGVTTELVSIVSPVAAAYPCVTIALAYLFLRERLQTVQKLGIGLILTGLITLALV